MSNIGKVFPSEIEVYTDQKSGRKVKKLTKSGANFHFYFTENSFTEGDREIIYNHMDVSADGAQQRNLFSMNLETGERKQLTDFAEMGFSRIGFVTKSINSKMIVFAADNNLYRLDTDTAAIKQLYSAPYGFNLAGLSISYDDRYVAVCLNEIIDYGRTFSGKNYDGFRERFFKQKRARIAIVCLDGTGGETVLEDTHQINHVQFAPDTNEYFSYCHEGPWNYVQQRIWMFNTVLRRVQPCFRQDEDDSVGHEFWTRDGLMFFDNRGRGHDGTITVDKTQAVTVEADGPDAIPRIGFADKQCNIVRMLDVPYYCNHYHANKTNTLLVGDAVNDIVLIDITTDTPKLEVLCTHETSWISQATHPHPTWSWSNDKILFASDRDKQGCPQIYLVEMK